MRAYTILLAATAVLGVTVAASSTVAAAPADVTATASVSGSDVSVRIVNTTPYPAACFVNGYTAPNLPEANPTDSGGATFRNYDGSDPNSIGVAPNTSRTYVFANVPDGTHSIHWHCVGGDIASMPIPEHWGTAPYLGGEGRHPSTAQPIAVTVPGGLCFGSACLPQESDSAVEMRPCFLRPCSPERFTRNEKLHN